MGWFSRKEPEPVRLDVGAVELDWAGHLGRVRLLQQLQVSATDPGRRGETCPPLLLRVLELDPVQQASLLHHQELLHRALWRREVAELLPVGPFRSYEQPWNVTALRFAPSLALLQDALLDDALSGRPTSLLEALFALPAGEQDELVAMGAVEQALVALALDPAIELLGAGPVIAGVCAPADRAERWPGAPEDWTDHLGRVDLDHSAVQLDPDEDAQNRLAGAVGAGTSRTFSISSTVPARLVGPRLGANAVGGAIFVGAALGLVGTFTEVLTSLCRTGVEPALPAPEAPALPRDLPVPITRDPDLDVVVRLRHERRGRLPLPQEPLDAPEVLTASVHADGPSRWVVELPLPHEECGPVDTLVLAHLRMLAGALLQLPGLSPEAGRVLDDVSAMTGWPGALLRDEAASSAAALARDLLAQGVAKP